VVSVCRRVSTCCQWGTQTESITFPSFWPKAANSSSAITTFRHCTTWLSTIANTFCSPTTTKYRWRSDALCILTADLAPRPRACIRSLFVLCVLTRVNKLIALICESIQRRHVGCEDRRRTINIVICILLLLLLLLTLSGYILEELKKIEKGCFPFAFICCCCPLANKDVYNRYDHQSVQSGAGNLLCIKMALKRCTST